MCQVNMEKCHHLTSSGVSSHDCSLSPIGPMGTVGVSHCSWGPDSHLSGRTRQCVYLLSASVWTRKTSQIAPRTATLKYSVMTVTKKFVRHWIPCKFSCGKIWDTFCSGDRISFFKEPDIIFRNQIIMRGLQTKIFNVFFHRPKLPLKMSLLFTPFPSLQFFLMWHYDFRVLCWDTGF